MVRMEKIRPATIEYFKKCAHHLFKIQTDVQLMLEKMVLIWLWNILGDSGSPATRMKYTRALDYLLSLSKTVEAKSNRTKQFFMRKEFVLSHVSVKRSNKLIYVIKYMPRMEGMGFINGWLVAVFLGHGIYLFWLFELP